MASSASQGASEHSFEVLSTGLFDDDFEVITQDLPASSEGYPSGATEHGLSITRRVASSGATEHNALLTRTMAAFFKKTVAGKHGRKHARIVLESVIACNRSVVFRSDGTPVLGHTAGCFRAHCVYCNEQHASITC